MHEKLSWLSYENDQEKQTVFPVVHKIVGAFALASKIKLSTSNLVNKVGLELNLLSLNQPVSKLLCTVMCVWLSVNKAMHAGVNMHET